MLGQGRAWKDNNMRRTMYILDVIGSVSRSSKSTKIVGGWGFAPDLTGSLQRSPEIDLFSASSLAGAKRVYF